MEPWVATYYFSADRISDRMKDVPDMPGATFKETKERLEEPYEGQFQTRIVWLELLTGGGQKL